MISKLIVRVSTIKSTDRALHSKYIVNITMIIMIDYKSES